MGITNFCVLLKPFCTQLSTKPQYFDSILYDVQSLLHLAITSVLYTEESKLFTEMCRIAWKKLEFQLKQILSFASSDTITLILAFDGEGVPMKWPTQRARRIRKEGEYIGKEKYRAALFGTNLMALQVQQYFIDRLKCFRFRKLQEFRVIISGCNVPGEGEHKLFQHAEALHCKHPIIVSVDQDVFMLACMRLDRYKSIQIFRYGKFYPVNQLIHEWLPYSAKQLEICSFLFGNDFIPPIIGITHMNVPEINQALQTEDNEQTPPIVIAQFIDKMKKHIRYTEITHVDADMIISFWLIFLWLKDYYTLTQFPQKYMMNNLFDEFDRNILLSGLTIPHYSSTCYERAQILYRDAITNPVTSDQAVEAVFMHDCGLEALKTYWIKPTDEACVFLHVTKQS